MSDKFVHSYLERINYQGSLNPNLENLCQLQLNHLLTVPFENLDIHLKRRIRLDEQAFFNKIVINRRGGFCYELNGLFALLLKELGYKVTLLSAQVANDERIYQRKFGHLTLLVEVEGRWLVDVGFGDSFRQPLKLEPLIEQKQEFNTYRFIQAKKFWILQCQKVLWKPEYRFTLSSREIQDFAQACYDNQTAPDSIFTKKRIITRATKTGRITLVDNKLIITCDKTRQEVPILKEKDFINALSQYFGYDWEELKQTNS